MLIVFESFHVKICLCFTGTTLDQPAYPQSYEQRLKKTCLCGFRHKPDCTTKENGWLEAQNFGFKKKRDCTIYVGKQKHWSAVCSLAFVSAYAKSRFLNDEAQLLYL